MIRVGARCSVAASHNCKVSSIAATDSVGTGSAARQPRDGKPRRPQGCAEPPSREKRTRDGCLLQCVRTAPVCEAKRCHHPGRAATDAVRHAASARSCSECDGVVAERVQAACSAWGCCKRPSMQQVRAHPTLSRKKTRRERTRRPIAGHIRKSHLLRAATLEFRSHLAEHGSGLALRAGWHSA